VGDITKLTDAEDALAVIAAQTVVYVFNNAAPSGLTVSGKYDSKGKFTAPDGTADCIPLKMESSTNVSLTVDADIKIKLKVSVANKNIKINGTAYTSDSNGFVEATINKADCEDGVCKITKGDTMNLWWIEVTGA
ncbi:MAG: hypothetical protein K2O62_01125, partial [Clostridia bacterium]|nr:hypothetical protein [Clostridia bacterium]